MMQTSCLWGNTIPQKWICRILHTMQKIWNIWNILAKIEIYLYKLNNYITAIPKVYNLNESKENIESIGAGGLSGKPVRQRSTEVIRYLSEKTNGELKIIGVGGISSAADAIEKLNLSKSRSDTKRLIKSNGIKINDHIYSSSNFSLNLDRALDTAGWVMPTTSAALVRLPSVQMEFIITKRFKSNELIFIFYESYSFGFSEQLLYVLVLQNLIIELIYNIHNTYIST